jgi:hypothetical protein
LTLERLFDNMSCMCRSHIAGVVDQLAAADPATCDRAAIAALVADASRVRGWLDAFEARVARRVAELAAADGGDRPAAVIAGGGRRAGREAAAVERRGAAFELLPQLGEALAAGAVSADHVDAVARAVGELDDAGRAELAALDAAVTAKATEAASVEAFEREVRELTRLLQTDDGLSRHGQRRRQRCLRRWVDRDTGMCHTHLTVDPETDAKVAAVLHAAVRAEERVDAATGEQRTLDQLRADAAVALITGARAVDRRIPEVSVLIDLDTLRDRVHAATVCETSDGHPLPAETVRRLACDSAIIPIVLDGDGVVLDVGRQRRSATRDQRHALRAMYATCGFPGCGVRFADCDIHHVVPWHHGGPSNLDNLLPMCSVHHHLVHEGGWTLTLDPDRTLTITRPDGTTAHHGSTTTERPTPTVERLQASLAEALARFERPPPTAA